MDYSKYIDQGILIANEFVKAHGQTAWDTVLWLTVVDRLSVLAFVAPLILASVLLHFAAKKFWGKHEINKYDAWELPAVICTTLKWGTLIPISLILFNMWNWVGIFYPELYLAKQAMDKVLN